ncbi:MAG: LamG-like jellyroll fold domain-containing protein [Desulfonatronovibrionaceae bacterium]
MSMSIRVKPFQIMNLILLLGLHLIAVFALPACTSTERVELEGYTFHDQWAEVNNCGHGLFQGDLTIDMYVKLLEYPENWLSFIKKCPKDEICQFNLRIKNKNRGQFYYGTGTRPLILKWNPEPDLPLNEWVRLTAVRNMAENTLSLFINGNPVARSEKNLPPPALTSAPLMILHSREQAARAKLFSVRIWNRAFDSLDINRTANPLACSARIQGMLGCWIFTPGKALTIADSSQKSGPASIMRAN